MENIKNFFRRYKTAINGIIFLVGVILIIWASVIANENTWYDILMGTGGAFVSTSIITIFLIYSLPEESGDAAELIGFGLKRIHKDGKVVRFSDNQIPKRNLDFIGLNLQEGWSNNSFKRVLNDRIKNGLKVRILTLHPDAAFVISQMQKDDPDSISKQIQKLNRWVDNIRKDLDEQYRSSIEIRFYDNLPLFSYCRADNRICYSTCQFGASFGDNLTYEYHVSTDAGDVLTDFFQDCWDGKSNIDIVDYDRIRYHGKQKESVETVLKYFCEAMHNNSGKDEVIGVVVLFKDDLRRTIFSCNKGYAENYNCHRKDAGVVGKLVAMQQMSDYSKARITVFEDISREISIMQCDGSRVSDKLLKKQYHKKEFSGQDTNKRKKTSAILATGLYLEDQLIGAVTFDFYTFSKEYEKEAEVIQERNIDADLSDMPLLNSWVKMAFDCSKMIANMVGHYVSCDFQNLFDSTWEERK